MKTTGWHPRIWVHCGGPTAAVWHRRQILSFGIQVWVNLRIILAHTSQLATYHPVSMSSGCSINHVLKAPWMTWRYWETDAHFFCRILRTDLILWAQTCKSNTTGCPSWLLAALHLSPLSAIGKSVTCRLLPISFLRQERIFQGYFWEFELQYGQLCWRL